MTGTLKRTVKPPFWGCSKKGRINLRFGQYCLKSRFNGVWLAREVGYAETGSAVTGENRHFRLKSRFKRFCFCGGIKTGGNALDTSKAIVDTFV